ncbi:MAG: formylglycine-generating enzyme family protein [Amaricoccus sp.]|uniref:formylglycine-generating enzyme family protein n=1 Tax=Amaricoccus sp. TaxID=1872485 RepID=UPI00331512C7
MAEAPVKTGAKAAVEPGMIWVPGGRFRMGSDAHYPDERPAHEVVVDGFWMDRTPVTNRRFRRFVEATGHVTLAERALDPAQYPGASKADLAPGSLVFTPPSYRVTSHKDPLVWWRVAHGADWRHPLGPGSSIKGIEDHPVVHVGYADAEAYAAWAGKALPTEAEWEFAARGGLEDREFAWGDELTPGGRHMANTWQGEFPNQNLLEDRYARTSPVEAFPPNGYGLRDMIGNCWEWTADWYVDGHADPGVHKACCAPRNPRGPSEEEASVEPNAPNIRRKVLKGGSHLCAPNYCRRYRPAARHAEAVDTSTGHVSFRCVKRVPPEA